jgi:glycogen debranching enzyme
VLILANASAASRLAGQSIPATALAARFAAAEKRRRASFGSPLQRAADAYLVRRGAEQTIVAGYPWFTDWGRDTFIALRGLVNGQSLDVGQLVLAAISALVLLVLGFAFLTKMLTVFRRRGLITRYS